MYEKAMVMYIYAETPMHPGSGAVVNSPVDLPIQRERHTEYPIIQGSSLKGVLKGCARDMKVNNKKVFEPADIARIFGSEKSGEGAGAIAVTDGKILAFPVRTLAGAFGWVTCHTVLSRFKRDLANAGLKADWEVPPVSSETSAIVPEGSSVIVDKSVYIEDLKLSFDKSEGSSSIASAIQSALPDEDVYKLVKEKLGRNLIVVDDTIFKDLVKFTTEIVARIKVDPKTGTTAGTALWYEEYLPTDTLMYALILCTKRASNSDIEKLKKFDRQIIQIGGNETIGRGFAKIKVVMGDAEKP